VADSDFDNRLILVTGATGRQGGAVARELHTRGFTVRALTRDTKRPNAQTLANEGMEVVAGDFDDRTSLERAMSGVRGVYSVQNFADGAGTEVRHGIAVADAAARAGVSHLVYSSVDGVGRNTGVSFHESKRHIEERIRALRLPATIVRPVFFMDNWTDMRDVIAGGTLRWPLRPSTSLQQLARRDLAAVVADAFEYPDAWVGRVVDLAGDDLTMNEVADTFSRVLGKPVHYVHVSWAEYRESMRDATGLELGDDFSRMFQWLDRGGPDCDVTGLRKERPQLLTLERYLRTGGWEAAASADTNSIA
jgi:uncharacterized protein YbjT (DUF2867 family)